MCMYVHMYMYVYVYVYVCVYVCIYMRVGVHVHSCMRILFICTVQSLYYMRVYHRYFSTAVCVCGRGLEVGFVFRLFMFSACCWRGRLCLGKGGEVGFALYICIFHFDCFLIKAHI